MLVLMQMTDDETQTILVHEPKQILVPPEVAKVIIYFLKALVIHIRKYVIARLHSQHEAVT